MAAKYKLMRTMGTRTLGTRGGGSVCCNRQGYPYNNVIVVHTRIESATEPSPFGSEGYYEKVFCINININININTNVGDAHNPKFKELN